MSGPRIKNPENLLFGLFLVAVGVAGIVFAWRLPMGTAMRMGAGYFPNVVSGLVIAAGVVVLCSALAPGEATREKWSWRPLVVVLSTVVLFALFVERAGLFVSIVAMVLLSTLAGPDRRWRAAALFGVALAAGCIGLFRGLLGLPLPVWPTWLTG